MIINVNDENLNEVIEFVNETNSIKNIETDIIKNASLIYYDKIEGMLSYEKFSHIGLIRYFIFRKAIQDEDIYYLLDSIIKKAKEDDIYTLVSIAKSEDIVMVFESLGFTILNNEDVYVGETAIKETEFNSTIILKLDLQ